MAQHTSPRTRSRIGVSITNGTECQAHEVTGCMATECRAARLGVTVGQYHQLVTRPVQRSIAAQRRRAAARREAIRDYRD